MVLAGVVGNTWDVLVVDTARRRFLNLTRSAADEHDPAVSPDGTRIAFSARYHNNWDIYILTLADGTLERLTEHPAYDGYPSWSPDGSQLIFESHRNQDLDLFLVTVNSGQPRLLTEHSAADIEPIWLPDGQGVVFGSWRSGQRQLYHLDLETHTTNVLTTPGEEARQPALSPDGQYLAYVATRNKASQLQVRDMQSGKITAVETRHAEWPVWGVAHHRSLASAPALLALRLTGGGAYAYPTEWSLVSYAVSATTMNSGITPSAYHLTLPGLQWQRASCTSLETLPYADDWQPLSHSVPEHSIAPQDGLTILDDVETLQPRISSGVADSYQRLRQHTMDASGYDFLGEIYDAWRGLDHPDNTLISWHTAGRAFDVHDWYQPSYERVLYTTRQDMHGQTYFRIYLRAARQDGSQGKPLRESVWETDQGLPESPPFDSVVRQRAPLDGYFVDFTDLAEREGWTRIAALTPPDGDWTTNYLGMEFWHYERRDQMVWYTAMQRVFSPAQLAGRFTPAQAVSQGYTLPQMIRAGVPGASQVLLDGLSCHRAPYEEEARTLVWCEPRFSDISTYIHVSTVFSTTLR
jgi:TolB protein